MPLFSSGTTAPGKQRAAPFLLGAGAWVIALIAFVTWSPTSGKILIAGAAALVAIGIAAAWAWRGATRERLEMETEREARKRIEASEERLRVALEATHLGTWDFLPQTGEMRWDGRCRQTFGLRPLEPISYAKYLAGVHAEDRERVDAVFQRALDPNGPRHYDIEHRLDPAAGAELWPFGVERWCRATGTTFFQDGKAVRFIGTLQDITARKNVELERSRLLHEAQEGVRIRDEFVSVASHELKTPLTPLALRLAQLRRNAEKARDGGGRRPLDLNSLEVAEGQVQRLADLIETMLDASRIEDEQLTLNLHEVELVGLVHESARALEVQAARAGSVVSIDAPEPIVVRIDRLRMRQAVTHLLTNALKFGEGAPIEISIRSVDEVVQLRVRDHGIGIDPALQRRVFEKYGRGVSRNFGGLGLGLYLTRRLIEAMGGSISVESTPGEGATFTVSLPLNGAVEDDRAAPPV